MTTPLPLAGTSALVTGGGSGIGLASARHLLRDGASVTLMGRNEERLRSAVESLAADTPDGATVTWSAGDVVDEEALGAAVATASAGTGRLDICVASAGSGWVAPITHQTAPEAQSVLDTNVMGTFLTIKHAAGAMVPNNVGSIVAISSLASMRVHPWMSIYSAAKAGVDALVRTAADELGPVGVRINGVCPGLIDTELVAMPMADPDLITSYLVNTPGGRVGGVDDVASVVRFLAGPESGWVTGHLVPVDGGQHLRRGPDYGNLARMLYGPESTPGWT